MDLACVIQARAGSTRFPGKVLADLGGRPVLAFMLDRLRDLQVRHMVVATSTETADDEVAEVAETAGADVVRGPEDDVLARYALTVERYPCDAVIRLTADCPVADPSVVRTAIDRMEANPVDFLSNTLIRTFPDGLDVEIVSDAALKEAAAKATDPFEREHVVPYIYRRPESFSLAGFRTVPNLAHLRWTIDSRGDLDHVRDLIEGLGSTDFSWQDLLEREDISRPPGFFLRAAGSEDLQLIQSSVAVTQRGDEAAAEVASDASMLDDPARRVWVVEHSGSPVGWCRVAVAEGGVGVLEAGAADGFDGALEAIPGLVGGQIGHLRVALREPWSQTVPAGYALTAGPSVLEWERKRS